MANINFPIDWDSDAYKEFMKSMKEEIDKQVVAFQKMPIGRHVGNTYISVVSNLSPTDIDVKGKFPYQEPEVDEQGTYYGYKILKKYTHSLDSNFSRFVSPLYNVCWNEDGSLTADEPPNEYSMHGIHFTKRSDNPHLDEYKSTTPFDEDRVLVRCALFGTVVETEQGFRAHKAKIVGVFEDGYWTSYQDCQERSRTNSRSTAEETWKEARWRLSYGRWDEDIYPRYNPSADS